LALAVARSPLRALVPLAAAAIASAAPSAAPAATYRLMVLHPFPVELSGPIVRLSLRWRRCRCSELRAAPVDRWSDARTSFQPHRAAPAPRCTSTDRIRRS